MRQILRVNMSDLSTSFEPVPEGWSTFGGRALTDAIVFSEMDPTADPLSAESVLVFAPGFLSGTNAPNAGRLSVGGKSPLTGGIKESNSGGRVSGQLGRLRIAAIVVTGKPADADARYVLSIKPDLSVAIERHDELAGLGNYATYDALAAMVPEGARFGTVTNGPAGEALSKASGIAVSDMKGIPNRFAGRGGMGAVMGSKGLKAILVEDTGVGAVQPVDKEAFTEAARAFSSALKEHAVSGTGLPMYGTNVLMNILSEAGGLPTRNFSNGSFEGADAIGGESQRDVILKRGGSAQHGCSTGCVIQCSRYWVDEEGKYVTKGPEYETAWSFGADCGIDDLDAIAALDRACGDLGLDTIEMGATMAVYMDSGKIAFGDAEAALAALNSPVSGGAPGRVLWDGALATGTEFGVEHIPVVKGQAMPAYDPRSVQGIGVTYATSTQGADHTAGYTITSNILNVGGTVDPLSPHGQVELSRGLQIATAMLDSLGLCIFVAFPVLDIPEAFEAIWKMMSAYTGQTWEVDTLMQLGKETLTYERLFNKKAGFTNADDRLPGWMKTAQLPPHNATFQVPDLELDEVFDFVDGTASGMGIS